MMAQDINKPLISQSQATDSYLNELTIVQPAPDSNPITLTQILRKWAILYTSIDVITNATLYLTLTLTLTLARALTLSLQTSELEKIRCIESQESCVFAMVLYWKTTTENLAHDSLNRIVRVGRDKKWKRRLSADSVVYS